MKVLLPGLLIYEMKKRGGIKMKEEAEDALKEEAGVTSRCMPFEQEHIADTCIYCGKPAKHLVYWGKAY